MRSRRSIMRRCVHQAVLFGAAFLLALPPGWCQVLPRFGALRGSPAAVQGCCGHDAFAPRPPCSTPEQDKAPATSTCCCPTDSTLPAGPELPPADSSVALRLADSADVMLTGAWSVRDSTSLASAPCLQLLHRVWL